MGKNDFTKEMLVQDIWDAQSDLRISPTSIQSLAKMSLTDLQEMRNQLWQSAYPDVGLDLASRIKFDQECAFDHDEFGGNA